MQQRRPQLIFVGRWVGGVGGGIACVIKTGCALCGCAVELATVEWMRVVSE